MKGRAVLPIPMGRRLFRVDGIETDPGLKVRRVVCFGDWTGREDVSLSLSPRTAFSIFSLVGAPWFLLMLGNLLTKEFKVIEDIFQAFCSCDGMRCGACGRPRTGDSSPTVALVLPM